MYDEGEETPEIRNFDVINNRILVFLCNLRIFTKFFGLGVEKSRIGGYTVSRCAFVSMTSRLSIPCAPLIEKT